jgi:hypothetical protein
VTAVTPCATCGAPLHGRYCSECGEKRVSEGDMTLRAFVHYAVEAITNADAKLYVTLRTLVTRPGLLTREFMAGRRMPYLGPLQLFLVCNVAFFLLLQTGFGVSTFTTDLVFHRQQPLYGDVANEMLRQRLGELPNRAGWEAMGAWVAHATPEQQEFRARFNEASPRYANSMVILMVPLFALGTRLLRRRGLFVRELVFSFHYYAIVLLLLIVWPLLSRGLIGIHRPLTPVLNTETAFAVVVLGTCGTFLTLAFRVAHGDSRAAAFARAVVSLILMVVVLMLYRAILFFVVFWAV